jgi:hypothetical protein
MNRNVGESATGELILFGQGPEGFNMQSYYAACDEAVQLHFRLPRVICREDRQIEGEGPVPNKSGE